MFWTRSAIDVSTGYGAECFIKNPEISDPWSPRCFVSMVEAFLNHTQFRYPIPSNFSREHGPDAGIPELMLKLQMAGLLQADDSAVAEQIPFTQPELEQYFAIFNDWARTNRFLLKPWIQFHYTPELRKRHRNAMAENVHPAVQAFFDTNKKSFQILGRRIPTGAGQLLYAFDVTCRGRQYAALLGTNATYYSHPIRDQILTVAEENSQMFKKSWSWGRNLAWGIRSGRLRRNPNDVITTLANIKISVAKLNATVPTLAAMPAAERQDILNQVAVEADLPAVLKESIHKRIEQFFTTLHLGIALWHSPAIHLSVAFGNFIAGQINNVPGCVPKLLPFCRGLVQYPYITGENQGIQVDGEFGFLPPSVRNK